MSHFTVCVRVPHAEVTDFKEPVCMDDIAEYVAKVLAPYNEQPDKDDTAVQLEFEDVEPEYRKKYNEDSSTMILLASGERVCKYDSRFDNPAYWSKPFEIPKHIYPAGSQEIEVPLKERYSTFEEYMEDYCGMERNEDGRYGHWHNPKAKWDWYQIGGRWEGHFFGKNVMQVQELFDRSAEIEGKEQDKMLKFWTEWNQLIDGHPFGPWEGPRDEALELGWMYCKDGSELTGNEWHTKKWDNDRDRYDVYENKTFADLTKFASHFHPCRCYAFLSEEKGWISKGKMGWFGCSQDDGPESIREFGNKFAELITEGDPKDYLVIVDCHI